MLVQDLLGRVYATFKRVFGRTPLNERLTDIQRQALELGRYTDVAHLKEKTGDLLCATLALCHEAGWNPEALAEASLEKIESRRAQYASLGRKTRVAILGTACDPPTLGHVDALQFVLDASRYFDEGWLMPCYDHLGGKKLAPAKHRMNMASLAVQSDGRLKASSFEIEQELAGETYHSMRRLLEHPDYIDRYEFAFIIGVDNANTFATWVNAPGLERLMRFVIVPRADYVLDGQAASVFRRPPHICFETGGEKISNTASSRIRSLLEDHNVDKASIHLDRMVLNYILSNGLYGT